MSDPHETGACAVCGREILRAWIDGVQEPWRHWVGEPLDHPARPSGMFRVGPSRDREASDAGRLAGYEEGLAAGATLNVERLADALRAVGCDCAEAEGFSSTHGDDREFVAQLIREYEGKG